MFYKSSCFWEIYINWAYFIGSNSVIFVQLMYDSCLLYRCWKHTSTASNSKRGLDDVWCLHFHRQHTFNYCTAHFSKTLLKKQCFLHFIFMYWAFWFWNSRNISAKIVYIICTINALLFMSLPKASFICAILVIPTWWKIMHF